MVVIIANCGKLCGYVDKGQFCLLRVCMREQEYPLD